MVGRFVVLVCGGRTFTDRGALNRALDRLHAERPITLLVHGACPRGADLFAEWWARGKGVSTRPYEARWDDLQAPGAFVVTRPDGTRYNARAGNDRNREMHADARPDLVAAFPGGSGTADMVSVAEAAGTPVLHPIAQPSLVYAGFGL